MHLGVKDAHLVVTRNSGRQILCGLIQLEAPPYTGVIPFNACPLISDGQAFVLRIAADGLSMRPLPSTSANNDWRLSGKPLSAVASPDSPWIEDANSLAPNEFVCLVTPAVGVCGQWGDATQSWALVGVGARTEASDGDVIRLREGKLRAAGHLPSRLASRSVDALMAEPIWLAGDGSRYALPFSSQHGMWLRARAVALLARWAGGAIERKHILFAIKGDPTLGGFLGKIGETPDDEALADWWLIRRGQMAGPVAGPAQAVLRCRRVRAKSRRVIARLTASVTESR